jgi:hypothetical protein
MTSNTNTDTHAIDQLRAILPTVDPALLTGADCRAMLDLTLASMEARGTK